MPRRTYDRQFKFEAVKLIETEQLSVSEVARELNIHPNSIYR
jgi:transposase